MEWYNITGDNAKASTQVKNADIEYVHKGHVPAKYMGTRADQRDMSALGKEQVLRV